MNSHDNSESHTSEGRKGTMTLLSDSGGSILMRSSELNEFGPDRNTSSLPNRIHDLFNDSVSTDIQMILHEFVQSPVETTLMGEWLNDPVEVTLIPLFDSNETLMNIAVRMNFDSLGEGVQTLRKREQMFREIVNDQSELICRFNPDGKLLFVNTAYSRYYKCDKDNLGSANFFDNVPEEESGKIKDRFKRITPDFPSTSMDHRTTLPDGSLRWQHWSTKGFFSPEGNLLLFQAVGRDITTRKIAEEALLQLSSEKETLRLNLEAIFESITDGIITVDKELKVIKANRSISTIFDESEPLEPGLSLQMLAGPYWAASTTVLAQTIETKRPVREYRIESSMANPGKVVVLNTSPFLDRFGNFIGAVLTARDISRLADLEKKLTERHRYQNIIGKSEPMKRVYELIEQLAGVDTTVLVLGESGTGKELVAEALHYSGNRSKGPLVKVNCSALSENILESELFGHVRGAFTGAVQDKVGRFQAAENGTIFLDEIGDISPAIQLKLLRGLESKEFERVGDNRTYTADVRVVAATNVDIPEKVKLGTFREDLYYRLRVVVIHLPPLRKRREDIPLLVSHFVGLFRKSFNKSIDGVTDKVLSFFMRYDWPGNIRELKHTIEHACILCRSNTIDVEDLPTEMMDQLAHSSEIASPALHTNSAQIRIEPDSSQNMARKPKPTSHGKITREAILDALESSLGNKAKAARALGIGRRTLYRKLELFNLLDD